MDKKKIVFIVDDGLPSGGLFDALKAAGEQYHMDVEMIPMSDTLLGTRPQITIWDEHTVLSDIDFSKLEGRVDAMMGDGSYMSIKTGRRPSEPEFQHLPGIRPPGKSRVQQDIYEMIATQLNRSRDQVKDLFWPMAYGTGRIFGNHQQIPRTKQQPVVYADDLIPGVGADHPSRKREPKGPRGKWGKL